MQDKLIIFGDSFADPNDRVDENPDVKSWYEYLSEQYKVLNHALAGTGPHYSFKKYYDFIIDKNIKKDEYIVIFLLSGSDRIHFPNKGPAEMTYVNWDFDKKESWWCGEATLKRHKVYYESFKSEIDFLFLTMHDELMWANIKNLGFLYICSLMFNMKTIVFNTYGYKVWQKKSSQSSMDIQSLNSSIFYISPKDLGSVAYEEFLEREENNYNFIDYRRNHLSNENHLIMYNNLKKIIKNEYDTLLPFKKDIDYKSNFGVQRTAITGEFIYD